MVRASLVSRAANIPCDRAGLSVSPVHIGSLLAELGRPEATELDEQTIHTMGPTYRSRSNIPFHCNALRRIRAVWLSAPSSQFWPAGRQKRNLIFISFWGAKRSISAISFTIAINTPWRKGAGRIAGRALIDSRQNPISCGVHDYTLDGS